MTTDRDDPGAGGRARIGLGLFAVYVLLYAGFMALVLVRPAARPLGGVNLALTYGLGLIVAALVLAAVYMVACRIIDRRAGGG